MIPKLFENQKETIELLEREPRVFDMSDPGTAKTRAHAEAFARRRRAGGGKALVLAPKSILQTSWGDDIDKFLPGLRYSVAYATNRASAFDGAADIYITNHDAVKWLVKNLPKSFWKDFDTIIIDESPAYKHHTSARSRALRKLVPHFTYRSLLTGTPNSNTILDVHNQTLLLDDGERLGSSFWRFRGAVCEPVQVGPQPQMVKWQDKEGSEAAVFDMLRDISIRHKLEECQDIPPNHTYDVIFDLSAKERKAYEEILAYAITELEGGRVVTAVHASSINNKLLQIAAGGIYTGDGDEWVTVGKTRTELVMDLVDARDHSLMVVAWRWQRQMLLEASRARGYDVEVIDGSVTSDKKRTDIVRNYQAGKYKSLIIHPKSAGHGLTLTKGTATIMVSPTYNAEHYKQVFHRIYRAGQTLPTETIHVKARGTLDMSVYSDSLEKKLSAMQTLLDLVQLNKEITA